MAAGQAAVAQRLVAIEGIDGAGKSAVARETIKLLQDCRAPVVLAAEKQSPLGRVLCDDVLCMMPPVVKTLVFAADRAWTFAACVQQALDNGSLVVWERYVASALVYREAELRRTPDRLTMRYVRGVNSVFPNPGLTILLAIDVERARERTQGRTQVYNSSFLASARTLYDRRARREGWAIIDAAPPVERVAAQVAATIKEAFAGLFP